MQCQKRVGIVLSLLYITSPVIGQENVNLSANQMPDKSQSRFREGFFPPVSYVGVLLFVYFAFSLLVQCDIFLCFDWPSCLLWFDDSHQLFPTKDSFATNTSATQISVSHLLCARI